MSLLTYAEPSLAPQTTPSQQTSRTFPTQYAGRFVAKPILAELTECARRERLQIWVDIVPGVFCVLLDVTVAGYADAVERFGWFVDALLKHYSLMAVGSGGFA